MEFGDFASVLLSATGGPMWPAPPALVPRRSCATSWHAPLPTWSSTDSGIRRSTRLQHSSRPQPSLSKQPTSSMTRSSSTSRSSVRLFSCAQAPARSGSSNTHSPAQQRTSPSRGRWQGRWALHGPATVHAAPMLGLSPAQRSPTTPPASTAASSAAAEVGPPDRASCCRPPPLPPSQTTLLLAPLQRRAAGQGLGQRASPQLHRSTLPMLASCAATQAIRFRRCGESSTPCLTLTRLVWWKACCPR